MSKANQQLFHDLLCHKAKEYNNNYLHSIDIDELNKLVKDDLIWAANISIPKFSGNGKKILPKELLRLIETRKKLLKKIRKENLIEDRSSYYLLSTKIKKGINEFADGKWSNFMEKVGDYPILTRKFWQEINKIGNTK